MKRVIKCEKMRRHAPEIRRLLFDFVPMTNPSQPGVDQIHLTWHEAKNCTAGYEVFLYYKSAFYGNVRYFGIWSGHDAIPVPHGNNFIHINPFLKGDASYHWGVRSKCDTRSGAIWDAGGGIVDKKIILDFHTVVWTSFQETCQWVVPGGRRGSFRPRSSREDDAGGTKHRRCIDVRRCIFYGSFFSPSVALGRVDSSRCI